MFCACWGVTSLSWSRQHRLSSLFGPEALQPNCDYWEKSGETWVLAHGAFPLSCHVCTRAHTHMQSRGIEWSSGAAGGKHVSRHITVNASAAGRALWQLHWFGKTGTWPEPTLNCLMTNYFFTKHCKRDDDSAPTGPPVQRTDDTSKSC